MKTFSMLILLLCITVVNAQEELQKSDFKYHKSNTIYLAPGNFAFRNMQVGYERFIDLKNSVVVKANYGTDLIRYSSYSDPNTYVVNAELGYRRYILYNILKKENVADKEKQNLFGLYLNPFIGFQHYKNYEYLSSATSIALVEYENNAVLGGFCLGGRFDLAKGKITIDMYVGAAFKAIIDDNAPQPNYNNVNNGGVYQLSNTGVVPKGNVEIGFNF